MQYPNTWVTVLRPPADIMERLVYESEEEKVEREPRTPRTNAKLCPTPGCGKPKKPLSTSGYAGYCAECCKANARRFRAKRRAEEPENARRRKKRLNLCAVPGCSKERLTYSTGYSITRCRKHENAAKAGWRARRGTRTV